MATKSLYNKNDGVIVLTDANCTGSKITSGFKGPGVLKAYAVWCPHCQNKVDDFKALAASFKDEKIGLNVYVIEADINSAFASAAQIEGFPTIMYVDPQGNTTNLVDKAKQSVHDVPGILTALCTTKNKCLKKRK